MRYLGLDYGHKRIGVALSDASGLIASPHSWLPRSGDWLQALEDLVQKNGVEGIVIGVPFNLNGSKGKAALEALAFKEQIAAVIKLPIYEMDERLTTREAERKMIDAGVRRQQRKRQIDAVAAAILLQAFLDKEAEGN